MTTLLNIVILVVGICIAALRFLHHPIFAYELLLPIWVGVLSTLIIVARVTFSHRKRARKVTEHSKYGETALVVQVPVARSQLTWNLFLPSARWQSEGVRNARTFEAEGAPIRVVQARDLCLLKLRAGGPQDLLDAGRLLQLQDETTGNAWKAAASKLRMGEELKRYSSFIAAALGGKPQWI